MTLLHLLLKHVAEGGLWYHDMMTLSENTRGEDYYAIETVSFFVAVKILFPKYWPAEEAARGTIICKTTGFGAWVQVMGAMRSDNNITCCLV